MLSSRWGEPEDPPEAMRTPAARRALFEALHAADEPGIVLALRLSGEVKNAGIIRAVRECLGHASPVVRASAVGAMETLGLADHENRIAGFLDEPHEALRGAAVRYLLVRGPRPLEFARRVLEGNDEMLQRQALDVLFDFPCEARAALTAEWLDARIRSTRVEDHRLAARGAGVLASKSPERLRLLLANPDTEVRRIALRSAIRRPSRALIDVLLPLLLAPDLAEEARRAVSALGDAAMPGLEALLAGGQGTIAQSVASNTLAQMGSPRAVHALLELVRGGDLRLRYLGLRGLARVRVRAGKPIVSRVLAHRLFLRELRDLRASLDAAAALGTHASPEVRLLADSYRESADWAIERAMQALALWYEPRPLIGVIDRLRSRDPLLAPPALEFLEHVLPREIFAPVRKIFEPAVAAAAGEVPSPAALAEWIGSAWDSEDGWLRACAVRASRLVPGFDPARFAARHDDDPRVREELLALERVTARNPSSSLREAAC
jgi:hypothetical protein